MPAPPFPDFGEVSAPVPCCDGRGPCFETEPATCAAIGGFSYRGCTCDEVICNNEPSGACCFPETAECRQLTPNQCSQQDGIFMGFGTCCASVDNCSVFRTGACCREGLECDVTTEDECDVLAGQFHLGQPCEKVNCEIPQPLGACCLRNSDVCIYVTEAQCALGGGQWTPTICENVNCAPAPFPTGCRGIREASYIDREWSLDLCGAVPMMLTIRPEPLYPVDGTPQAEGFEPGMMEWVTLWPVRAMDLDLMQWRGDVCRHHFARTYVLDEGGMMAGVSCSKPDRGDVNSVQAHHIPVYVQEKPDVNTLPPYRDPKTGQMVAAKEQVPIGTMLGIGAYHTPWWTEGTVDSVAARCGGIG